MRSWFTQFWTVLGFSVCVGGVLAQSPAAVPQTVWSDPDPVALDGPWESSGFGAAFAAWRGGLLVASPRSNRDEPRAGALWFAQTPRADRLRRTGSGSALAAQVFGSALAVQPGSHLLAVGAPLAPGVGVDPGWVYLFDSAPGRSSGSPVPGPAQEPVAILRPDHSMHADGFGSALMFDADGLWVSAPFGHFGEERVGYVARFEWCGGTWCEVERLYGPPGESLPRFGHALLAMDGEVWISAPWAGPGGRVYRYKRDGKRWARDGVLEAPVALGAGAQFGTALGRDGAGEWFFVGAPLALGRGRVQAFRKTKVGALDLGPSFAPPLEHDMGRFGAALQAKDGWLWVGAPEERGALCGFPKPWTWPQWPAVWRGHGHDRGLGAAVYADGAGCFVGVPGRGIVMFRPPPPCRVVRVENPQVGHGPLPVGWGGPGTGSRWMVQGQVGTWLGFGLPPGLSGTWRLCPVDAGSGPSGGVGGAFRSNHAGEIRLDWTLARGPWPGGWLRLRSPGRPTVQIRIPAG